MTATILNVAAHLALLSVLLVLAIVLTLMLFATIKAIGVLVGVWFVWTCNVALLAVAVAVFTRSV